MLETGRLRNLIEARFRRGETPKAAPERTWGGLSAGASCAGCGYAIGNGGAEIECQLQRPGLSFFFHPLCFRIWHALVMKAS